MSEHSFIVGDPGRDGFAVRSRRQVRHFAGQPEAAEEFRVAIHGVGER
jgi:hypothetical protein